MANDFMVCIVGLGPAGLAAGLQLSKSSISNKVVCFEAGNKVEARSCSIQRSSTCKREDKCQVIMGVGGASVLSGCKLSTFPAGKGIAPFVGGEESLDKQLTGALNVISQYLHIFHPGSRGLNPSDMDAEYAKLGFTARNYHSYLGRHDDLAPAYNKMLSEMSSAGETLHLNTLVNNIRATHDGFDVAAQSDGQLVHITCDRIVIATGRSGMGLLSQLDVSLGLCAMANRCDVGVRLEFPVDVWPEIDKYHNDLKLHFESPEIGEAQTFCVSKNGMLAPYRWRDFLVIDGHINAGVSSGFTNLAIMVRQDPRTRELHMKLLDEIRSRILDQTDGMPVRQDLISFLRREAPSNRILHDNNDSSISCWCKGRAEKCFPPQIGERIWHAVSYFTNRLVPKDMHGKVSVFAPALEYYWPKFPLRQGFVSKKSKVHMIGDCTGHFRGILQAFCSGLTCAKGILEEHVS